MAAVMAEVFGRTVQIVLPPEGMPYHCADFVKGLARLGISEAEIEAVGPLRSNKVWHLTLKTAETRQKVLAARTVKVGNHQARLYSMDDTEVTVRVHWAPYFVPMGSIAAGFIAAGGTVEHCEYEVHSTSFKGCKSLTRVFVVKGLKKEEVPHLMEVKAMDKDYQLLCTVSGRQPMCLRCKKVGHYGGRCTEVLCARCGVVGHATENCPGQSFAQVVRGRGVDQGDLTEEVREDTVVTAEERERQIEVDNNQVQQSKNDERISEERKELERDTQKERDAEKEKDTQKERKEKEFKWKQKKTILKRLHEWGEKWTVNGPNRQGVKYGVNEDGTPIDLELDSEGGLIWKKEDDMDLNEWEMVHRGKLYMLEENERKRTGVGNLVVDEVQQMEETTSGGQRLGSWAREMDAISKKRKAEREKGKVESARKQQVLDTSSEWSKTDDEDGMELGPNEDNDNGWD